MDPAGLPKSHLLLPICFAKELVWIWRQCLCVCVRMCLGIELHCMLVKSSDLELVQCLHLVDKVSPHAL